MSAFQTRPIHPAARRAAIFFAVLASAAAPADAVTRLQRGDTPPPIELTGLDGNRFKLADQKGRPVVLIFGELYHERSLAACRAVADVARESRIAESRPICELIVAQQGEPAELKKAAEARGVSVPVLHDKDRSASAAYEVSVLPSVVVIDGQGRVVHALAGLSASFRDTITDALLLAGGKLSSEQFSKALHPSSAPDGSSEGRRAVRLTELARQLARGGMPDLAAEKYQEALRVDPRCIEAMLGLGRTELKRRNLTEAEKRFREALQAAPRSTEAQLGIGYVLMLRGGTETATAEKHVRAAISASPNDPEAHYLLGCVLEQAGRPKDAAASYRKAAELLLERGD